MTWVKTAGQQPFISWRQVLATSIGVAMVVQLAVCPVLAYGNEGNEFSSRLTQIQGLSLDVPALVFQHNGSVNATLKQTPPPSPFNPPSGPVEITLDLMGLEVDQGLPLEDQLLSQLKGTLPQLNSLSIQQFNGMKPLVRVVMKYQTTPGTVLLDTSHPNAVILRFKSTAVGSAPERGIPVTQGYGRESIAMAAVTESRPPAPQKPKTVPAPSTPPKLGAMEDVAPPQKTQWQQTYQPPPTQPTVMEKPTPSTALPPKAQRLSDEQIQDLLFTQASLQGQIQQLRDQLAEAQRTSSATTSTAPSPSATQVDTLSQQIQGLLSERQVQEQTIQKLGIDLHEAQRQNAQLREKLALQTSTGRLAESDTLKAYEQKIAQLSDQTVALRRQVQSAEQKAQEFKAFIDAHPPATEQVNALQAHLEKAKGDLEKAIKTINDQNRQIQSLTQKMESFDDQVLVNTSEDVSYLNEKLEAKEAYIKQLLTELHQVKLEKNSPAKGETAEDDSATKALNQELQTLRSERQHLAEANSKLQRELEALQAKAQNDDEARSPTIAVDGEALRQELTAEITEKLQTAHGQEVQSLKQQLSELRQVVQSQKGLQEKSDTLEDLKGVIADKDRALAALKQELAEANERLKEAKIQTQEGSSTHQTALELKLAEQTKALEALGNTLLEKDKTLGELNQRVAQMTLELQRAKQTATASNTLQEKVAALHTQAKALEQENNILKQQLKDAQVVSKGTQEDPEKVALLTAAIREKEATLSQMTAQMTAQHEADLDTIGRLQESLKAQQMAAQGNSPEIDTLKQRLTEQGQQLASIQAERDQLTLQVQELKQKPLPPEVQTSLETKTHAYEDLLSNYQTLQKELKAFKEQARQPENNSNITSAELQKAQATITQQSQEIAQLKIQVESLKSVEKPKSPEEGVAFAAVASTLPSGEHPKLEHLEKMLTLLRGEAEAKAAENDRLKGEIMALKNQYNPDGRVLLKMLMALSEKYQALVLSDPKLMVKAERLSPKEAKEKVDKHKSEEAALPNDLMALKSEVSTLKEQLAQAQSVILAQDDAYQQILGQSSALLSQAGAAVGSPSNSLPSNTPADGIQALMMKIAQQEKQIKDLEGQLASASPPPPSHGKNQSQQNYNVLNQKYQALLHDYKALQAHLRMNRVSSSPSAPRPSSPSRVSSPKPGGGLPPVQTIGSGPGLPSYTTRPKSLVDSTLNSLPKYTQRPDFIPPAKGGNR